MKMRRTHISGSLRLLIGGSFILVLVAADTLFVLRYHGNYWDGLKAGRLTALGIALCVWWMRWAAKKR